MDAIETAIRNAFEKGDAEDRAFREAVYRKAFAALDRAIQANPNLTVEVAIRRRKVLQDKIAEIETEYLPAVAPAVGPAAPAAPRVEPGLRGDPVSDGDVGPAGDPLSGAVEMRFEPGPAPEIIALDASHDVSVARLAADRAGLGGIDTRDEARAPLTRQSAPISARSVDPDPDPRRPRRRRRPFVWMFIAATVVAAVGLGGWFAAGTGLFLSREERDGSVPNPPPAGEESYIPEDEEPPVLSSEPDSQRDWIAIFSPRDAQAVSAPTGTRAEAMQDDSGSFLRITSGGAGEAVSFDVGQGVLERIAGRKVTFDIVARAADEAGTEMAVDCNFGELGDCGRKRYALNYDQGDYLFELSLPAARPGAGGAIAINPDFSNGGKAVDIYEIKVSLSP
ncbi:MAG: hypothetical protein KF914_21045 [Rhizobiaceae bacterium]|nr:hypothetical protein [Rhizobiaceae bacterium]